jgi:hypothetical protein
VKRWAKILLGSVAVAGAGLYLSADYIKLNLNRWITAPVAAEPCR